MTDSIEEWLLGIDWITENVRSWNFKDDTLILTDKSKIQLKKQEPKETSLVQPALKPDVTPALGVKSTNIDRFADPPKASPSLPRANAAPHVEGISSDECSWCVTCVTDILAEVERRGLRISMKMPYEQAMKNVRDRARSLCPFCQASNAAESLQQEQEPSQTTQAQEKRVPCALMHETMTGVSPYVTSEITLSVCDTEITNVDWFETGCSRIEQGPLLERTAQTENVCDTLKSARVQLVLKRVVSLPQTGQDLLLVKAALTDHDESVAMNETVSFLPDTPICTAEAANVVSTFEPARVEVTQQQQFVQLPQTNPDLLLATAALSDDNKSAAMCIVDESNRTRNFLPGALNCTTEVVNEFTTFDAVEVQSTLQQEAITLDLCQRDNTDPAANFTESSAAAECIELCNSPAGPQQSDNVARNSGINIVIILHASSAAQLRPPPGYFRELHFELDASRLSRCDSAACAQREESKLSAAETPCAAAADISCSIDREHRGHAPGVRSHAPQC